MTIETAVIIFAVSLIALSALVIYLIQRSWTDGYEAGLKAEGMGFYYKTTTTYEPDSEQEKG